MTQQGKAGETAPHTRRRIEISTTPKEDKGPPTRKGEQQHCTQEEVRKAPPPTVGGRTAAPQWEREEGSITQKKEGGKQHHPNGVAEEAVSMTLGSVTGRNQNRK